MAPALSAQAIEDPGPFIAGWRDVTFDDVIFGQGIITGRMYYPALSAGQGAAADPSGGPYPLTAFQHGWLGRPSNYDLLCEHIASWGFVVASTGTETGLFPNTDQYARDTRSFLHWVEAEAGNPSSWLTGMTGSGDWAAAGHSMGGGTLALLIGIEPRVRTIVGLQSASSGNTGVQNMQVFTGNAFQVAGEVDWIVPPATVYDWFREADSARRNVFFLVEGMGHTGCLDDPSNSEPLPGPEQHRMHRRLVTGLLRAETFADESLFADILGEGIAVEPLRFQSDCRIPPFWSRISTFQTGNLVAGLAGKGGANAFLACSLVPASITTPYGQLGLDPGSATVFHAAPLKLLGWHEEILPIQPAWSGQILYLQGLVTGGGNGVLTGIVEIDIP
jgi:hypothetical protein